MNFVKPKVFDITKKRPAVLLVGNGLNRCMGDDTTWDNAILKLAKDDAILDKIKRLDYSIRATVTADEDNSKRWSRYVKLFDNDFKYFDNPLLKNLLCVPFDAVLTTNYTYELENALDKNFPRSNHKESWACTTAAADSKKRPDSARYLNTFNRLKNKAGKDVDIWHIHGEVREPASMILTHEEYGRLVTELVKEEQEKLGQNTGNIRFDSWQDYFVYGDLYILGQGVNFAEFDLWWMLSRRRREKTGHGRMIYYAPQQPDEKFTPVEEALDQIGVFVNNCGLKLPIRNNDTSDKLNSIYQQFYSKACESINQKIQNPIPVDTEKLIEYRDKLHKIWSKVNYLRLLFQLSKTTVYVPFSNEYGGKISWALRNTRIRNSTPVLYHYYSENEENDEDRLFLPVYSTKSESPEKEGFDYELRPMTGIEALRIAHSTQEADMIWLDPNNEMCCQIECIKADLMLKDPDLLEKSVYEAEERDLMRRKNNALSASEEFHYIRSYITNNSFPESLDTVKNFVTGQGYFSYESVYYEPEVEWTTGKDGQPGDIVFFLHTRAAKTNITRLQTELKKQQSILSKKDYDLLDQALKKASDNFDRIGGKIYAVGQVLAPAYEDDDPDDPFYIDPKDWGYRSRDLTTVGNIFILDNPVSMDDFTDFIFLSRGGDHTTVVGENFSKLKKLILNHNKDQNNIPMYFLKSTALPPEFSEINDDNWMSVTEEYRQKASSKTEFSSFYADYLLKELSESGEFWSGCRFKKTGETDAYMENVILFGGYYLPVKILFYPDDMKNAPKILQKACHASQIMLTKEKIIDPSQFYPDHVLILDRESVLLYDANIGEICPLSRQDGLRTAEDVKALKDRLSEKLASRGPSAGQSQNDPGNGLVSEPSIEPGWIAAEPDSYTGTVYKSADCPVTPIGWQEFCMPSNKAEIARRAVLITEGEGVIERDKLIERLRSSFGVKNSEKVAEAMEKGLKTAKIRTTKVRGVHYCWASGIDPKMYTGFRYHEEVKRRDDELPLPEIRNAAVRTLMDNGPLDEDELILKTSRIFGYQRLGPNLKARLVEGIDYAVSDKKIRLNKQKKYELREQ